MRNPKILSIAPNYRKKVFSVVLKEGRNKKTYELSFSVFKGLKIGAENPVVKIVVEKDLNSQSAQLVLKNGKSIEFPADLVLYHCDSDYDWSPINQIKQALRERLDEAKISVRVLAKALHTSPSQVERLLAADKASKQLVQLCKTAEIVDCHLEFKLKERKAH